MPILLVVDDDPPAREALAADLGRSLGVDYAVVTQESPIAALTLLERWAAESEPVALIFAGQRLTEMSATEFLVAAHALHPSAKRILRLERGD